MGYIASQYPNKRTMIAQENKEVGIDNESEDKEMPPIKEASDHKLDDVDGEALIIRRALNAQIKNDDMEQKKKKIYLIQSVM